MDKNNERQKRWKQKHGLDKTSKQNIDYSKYFYDNMDEFIKYPPSDTIYTQRTSKLSLITFNNYIKTITKMIGIDNEIKKQLKSILVKQLDDTNEGTDEVTIPIDIYEFIKLNIKNINQINAVFSHINFPNKKYITPYSNKYMELYNYNRDLRKPMNENINDISFNINDVMKKIETITPLEKLIIGLFTMIDIHRPNDFRIMIISTKPPSDNDNNVPHNNNVYYNGNIYIYNQKIKTELNVIKLPAELTDIINQFIEKEELTDGDYLLGRLYPASSLTMLVKMTFNKIYGTPYTPTEIRRLYATHIKNERRNGTIDYNEMALKTKNMGHSINQNKLYSY